MGKQRKPAKVLELSGAYKKNPNRENKNEPDGNGSFPDSPPDHLDEMQKRHWLEIKSLVPAGVLTGSDTLAVEILAVLLTQFREDYEGFTTAKLNRLSLEMGRLGLAPSDRVKLSVSKPSENKFAN